MFIWHDSETVGLQGPMKLNQFSVDDNPVEMIKMFKGWENNEETRKELLQLLDLIDRPDTTYVGFNIQFDLFHLYRLKHRLLGYEYDSKERPVMPFKCKTLDLQQHAMLKSVLAPFAFNRAGSKSVAVIRRIPKVAQEYVAKLVIDKLKPLLPQSFDVGITVHKQKQKDLVSLAFKVKGRLSLKGLMNEYGIPTIKLGDVWPLPDKKDEKPWLPYPDPLVHDPIEQHCDIVMSNPNSRFFDYSKLDILYLKVLYDKLGQPEPDYNDSCAHNLAYLRYYGFDLDRDALDGAELYYKEKVERIESQIAGTNLRSSKERLALLKPYFPLLSSTNKSVLKKLAQGEGEGAKLCEAIVEYGPSRQRLLQIQKVQESKTGRAHPDLRNMGTATNRMAGNSGLNWQGVSGAEERELAVEIEEIDEMPDEWLEQLEQAEDMSFIRKEKIGLRTAMLTPCVGDWSSFEVRIANAVYGDEQLNEDLKNGIDLHSMGTVSFHPDFKDTKISYDEFKAGYHFNMSWDKARKGIKAVIFGSFYFCTAHAVSEALGIPEFEAQGILDGLYKRYSGMKRYRAAIEADFLTADTEKWSRGSVRRMKRSLKDLTGFERRWDFEADVATTMWELGHSQIRSKLEGHVVRSQEKGRQTIDNAIRSALLGSAIAIQAAVSRQAGNMKIQATGSSLNKMLQAEMWDRFRVPTLSVHDELFPPHHPNFDFEKYGELIKNYERKASGIVPMLKFDFARTIRWSDK